MKRGIIQEEILPISKKTAMIERHNKDGCGGTKKE